MTDVLRTYTFGLAALLLTLVLLQQGAGVLIPLAIATVIWFIIDALAGVFERFGWPRWIRTLLSTVIILISVVATVTPATDNTAGVIDELPVYQQNIDQVLANLQAALPLDDPITLPGLLASQDVQSFLQKVAGALASFVGNLGLVLAYVLFLFFSQQTFDNRLEKALPEADRLHRTRHLLSRIQHQVRTYLWAKTLMSLLTAVVCAGVLLLVGVKYPMFWAFWIFLLNFVPYLGSALGVILPALLTLVQFDSPVPFAVVLISLTVIQVTIDNVVEPRYMGRTLNVDPLVVMIALVLWGTLWGMAGMFLAIPLTAIVIIALAQVPGTRWLAVLMSQDGEVK